MKTMLMTAIAAFFSLAAKSQIISMPIFPENECDSSLAPAMVDFAAYEQLIAEVKTHRKQHLVNFKQFLVMRKAPNVVVLDTRSDSMYRAKHIKGAIHLNFSDFTQANLRRLIPDPNTKILIYCNNNFKDDQRYFMTKAVDPKIATNTQKALTLALNIPTYVNLYGYGYRNVFELSEMISIRNPFIEFEGTGVLSKRAIVSR
jgi:hypothetical protein